MNLLPLKFNIQAQAEPSTKTPCCLTGLYPKWSCMLPPSLNCFYSFAFILPSLIPLHGGQFSCLKEKTAFSLVESEVEAELSSVPSSPQVLGKDLISKVVAGGRAFPAASFGICCAIPVEGSHGLLCLPDPEAVGLQGFTLQTPATWQGGQAGMDLLAEVLLTAIFHKGPDALRLMVAGQEQVAAGRQKAHSIRKDCAYGAQHWSWLLPA